MYFSIPGSLNLVFNKCFTVQSVTCYLGACGSLYVVVFYYWNFDNKCNKWNDEYVLEIDGYYVL